MFLNITSTRDFVRLKIEVNNTLLLCNFNIFNATKYFFLEQNIREVHNTRVSSLKNYALIYAYE